MAAYGERVKYTEMLRDRDDSIESQVIGLIPRDIPSNVREDFQKNVHEAFERGAKLWAEQYLPVLLGAEAAATLLEKLEREHVLS